MYQFSNGGYLPYSCFGGMFDEDGGPRYEGYARKSGAAERRENEARQAFTSALKNTELDGKPSAVVQLLKPNTHLTQASWGDFNKWVKTHTGCSARRRAASDAEKRAHGEKRQGTTYFIDVTITASAQAKATGKRAAEAPAPTQPAAKKAAPGKSPVTFGSASVPTKQKSMKMLMYEGDEAGDILETANGFGAGSHVRGGMSFLRAHAKALGLQRDELVTLLRNSLAEHGGTLDPWHLEAMSTAEKNELGLGK